LALRYKDLWMVEPISRVSKSVLETRPIYHKCDATIRGHVFCSFLALVLMKELEDRLAGQFPRLELGPHKGIRAVVVRLGQMYLQHTARLSIGPAGALRRANCEHHPEETESSHGAASWHRPIGSPATRSMASRTSLWRSGRS
jgi:hypothetical protein